MKKVLIIAFFWPYTSGSKRVIGLAKYLPQYGWQPIILTGPLIKKPPDCFSIIQTPYQSFLGPVAKLLGLKLQQDTGDQLQQRFQEKSEVIKKPLRFFYNLSKELFAFPDEYKNWQTTAIKAANNLIKKQKIDALISIWPLTSHLVARKLKQTTGINWLADFPDLWSENAAYSYSALRHYFDRQMEIATLKSADIITTSSQIYQKKLSQIHQAKKIIAINLGFDPANLNPPPAILTQKLSITYTGMLYGRKRNPDKFLQALAELIQDKIINPQKISVRFFGPQSRHLNQNIQKLELANCVKQFGPVPLDQCLARQKESQILLQLNWEDDSDKGVFSGKMLDYLASLRPILAVGGKGQDVVSQWLKDTGAGVYCPKITGTKIALTQFYQEYEKNGFIQYHGDITKVKNYSSDKMAQHFAKALDQIN
ncbi:MAG: hypothetical protein COS76_03950 [Candidatus Portnoybacteria bacterium CG06_land_8_20_14_3_00_39_12]|uniref:Glycosyltransferase subfamily 4-like N-terminal domain-containing protein n=3 Tax=Candidatus Portnoyibacteriota TaxID=1817913 RepID=A0A2M8KFI4_9BACT|nr:MAG: hypothetical protein AUJ33_00665 [Parcubacteria group bacterium CG1_02_40_25]PIU74858.1 MAG: hypothetical protein COS76_03950 [Candidatus Portnoybacteria bacterium CG06_land_8_20_14_3_00_39_12]PIZ71156.1 MAG: hypothetical protein COY09_01315 [Candidatus Portnoybacteria bacterium CG_4_10_14_0_2_um_filter_39_11]PJE58664.1 MAG: hypothetical protein COU83_02670 [Candidatus Portnoybacteria bacterium CG10_big_fil_rev_8_21_14_0_10_40_22]